MGNNDTLDNWAGGGPGSGTTTANESPWWVNENTGNAIKHSGGSLGNDKPSGMNQSSWDYLKQGENNP